MAKKSNSSSSPVTKIVCIVLAVAVVLLGARVLMLMNEQKEAERLAIERNTVKLPANAVKITECIPNMGEHWVEPANVPNGPYYITYQGKVLALEFMIGPDQIPGENIAKGTFPEFINYLSTNNMTLGDFIKQNRLSLPVVPAEYKRFHIDWTSPHAGFVTPHYDIHLYLVEDEELQNVCPEARIEDAYSPDVLKSINENNIPFPVQ